MATTTARSNPLAYLTDELNTLKTKGTHFRLRVLDDEQAAVCTFDGKKVINLASNNYLGLTTHPKLREAALEATRKYGVGSGAVRTIAGTMKIHMELEERIARFKNVEACVVFQSGFAANAGTVSAVLGKEDFIISDQLNHVQAGSQAQRSFGQKLRRPAESNARPELAEQVNGGARYPAVINIAHDGHLQSLQRFLVAQDGVGIEQRLRGMLMHAVAGVDHGNVQIPRHQRRRARLRMANDNHVRAHRPQGVAGVQQGLSFFDAGSAGEHQRGHVSRCPD